MLADNSIEFLSPLQPHTFLESWYELSDESHFWFQWRLSALMQQLIELDFPIHKKLKVLDVGCGTGVLRSQIEAVTEWDIDATDLDYNALCRAKPGRGRILYYDILEEKAELKENYDVVVLFDVLEHIKQPRPFIKALLHHLKIGGHLLVNVPALQWLYSRYDEIAGHTKRYSKITLRDELFNYPLVIRDVRYWGLINIPILLARKLWLAHSGEKNTEEVIKQGMKPPNSLVNNILLHLMYLEMALTSRPSLGASVLMVGEKVVDERIY